MTESLTLLSVLFPGKGIVDVNTFMHSARERIRSMFQQMGEAGALGKQIAFDSEPPTMLAAQDRRLLACMTSIMKDAKWSIENDVRDKDRIEREMNMNSLNGDGLDTA
jgi:hypothetical protein